ncbi:MAG: 3-deoxy-manno-octulosonate cytidylyltransferase, partial [Bacteroidota bacterium]
TFGGQVEMTASTHPSGTDRCAEVAARHPEFECVVNVQGDEPFIQSEQIACVVRPLIADASCTIVTLAKKIVQAEQLFNPNIVKVVFGQQPQQQALYFSRQAIPFLRDKIQTTWWTHQTFYKHLGLYAFRQTTLLELTKLQESPLETAERLEQLRWLEHGHRIQIALTDLETQGIDTPEDLKRVKLYYNIPD